MSLTLSLLNEFTLSSLILFFPGTLPALLKELHLASSTTTQLITRSYLSVLTLSASVSPFSAQLTLVEQTILYLSSTHSLDCTLLSSRRLLIWIVLVSHTFTPSTTRLLAFLSSLPLVSTSTSLASLLSRLHLWVSLQLVLYPPTSGRRSILVHLVSILKYISFQYSFSPSQLMDQYH